MRTCCVIGLSSAFAGVAAGVFAGSARAELVTHTFGGRVTALPSHVNPLPAPWTGAQIGDEMVVSFTYETSSVGSPSGIYTLHRGVVSAWSVTIGGATLAGTLPPVPTTSSFWVHDGASDIMLGDFVTAPGASAKWGLGLTDHEGMAFGGGGALPSHLRFDHFDEVSMGLWRTPSGSPADSLQSTIEWYVPGPGTTAAMLMGLAGVVRRRHR